MVMSLKIKKTSFAAAENQTWLASAHGTQEMDSITLDGPACAAAFPSGVVPSGIPLTQVAATGRWAPSLDNGTATDDVAGGHLFTTIDLTAGGAQPANSNSPASLFWHGEVVLARIPTYAGRTDLAVAANRAPHIRYV